MLTTDSNDLIQLIVKAILHTIDFNN
jgi:hypothetical protein